MRVLAELRSKMKTKFVRAGVIMFSSTIGVVDFLLSGSRNGKCDTGVPDSVGFVLAVSVYAVRTH